MKRFAFIFLSLSISLHLFAQTPASKLETVIQKGHSAAVKAVAVSPNGEILATGSRDKSVKLWDRQTGMEIRSLVGHEHTVNALTFSPNGQLLATSSADGTARVWEILTGKQIFSKVKLTPQDSYQFSTSGLSDAVYLVELLTNDNRKLGQKIIISNGN